ncbi:uncharacterized protein MELLADRAFT_28766, partial [Melampsora larici-populina 98AG31]
ILADDMGLGKTIQTISLIATTLEASRQFKHQDSASDLNHANNHLRPSHTTLLICPTSLMDNWEHEVEKHTKKNSLKIMRWHGIDRVKLPLLVIDEAHIIRNDTSSHAVLTSVESVNRLCLTGTPLHNRIGDLHMLFKFLRIKPFHQDSVWYLQITLPVHQGNLDTLNQLLRYFMLRRTKASHLRDLPPIYHETILLDMHPQVKQVYQ